MSAKGLLGKMDKDRAKAKNFPIQDVSHSCNVCEIDIVRTAITVDDVKICHSCLKFLKMQAELNNRTWEKEVKYQTDYINDTD